MVVKSVLKQTHNRLFGALRAGLVAGVVLALCTSVNAQSTANFTSVADNTLYEDAGGAWSNAQGIGIFAGRTNAGKVRRGLVRFDLSLIPAGSTVTAASVKLTLTRTNVNSTVNAVGLHRVSAAWGEGTSNAFGEEGQGNPSTPGDATWIHRFYSNTFWSTPGGDFNATASASANVGDLGVYTWTSATLVADVQNWVNTPANNFGWLIRGNETTNQQIKRFASREDVPPQGSPPTAPVLIVTYTPPPGSGACCQPVGTCVVTLPAGCASLGGTFQGVGTACAPNPCFQPPGACCMNNGTCSVVLSADCASLGGTYQGNLVTCAAANCPVLLTPFVDALPIPAIAQPTTGSPGGAAHYDIAIREFTQQLHRDLPATRLWGYNGTYPGPTIEARRGLPVTVTWTNDLRDSSNVLRTTHLLNVDTCLHGPDVTGGVPNTVTHLHGLKVAPESDGFPDASFPPGQHSPLYTYPNDQPATTLWYHDHALGLTRLNVYMGIAAFYLIRDTAENSLNIPRGEFEIPMVIQDRTFNSDGSLRYNTTLQDNFFGDKILVNGKVWPYLNVKRGKYRFRLLNGSNSRTYTLSLNNGATFQQIGSDGGLLASPVTISSVTIQPAERADIVIDFVPYGSGTEIILSNSAPAPFPGTPGVGVVPDVMKFVVQGATGDPDPLPASLASVPRIPESQSIVSRDFKLRTAANQTCGQDTWLINDLMWDDITDFVRIGTTETWSFTNYSVFTHPIHVHLVQFQILDRQPFNIVNDQVVTTGPRVAPPANELGWKDTVQCPPLQITRVIAKFEGFYGLFPIHCHILEHEDHEMMRQFQVLCDAPVITSPPTAATVNENATAMFTVSASGDIPSYRWRRNNVALNDGPGVGGVVFSGVTTPTLTITTPDSRDNGVYQCQITSPCGQVTTPPVNLIVVPACPGDLNHDGIINTADLTILLGTFGSNIQPGSGGDINASGNVNTADLTILLGAFGSNC